jgi:hypothetical protein
MEDIENILPHKCIIPINPYRETTFLTSASSEYERESLREVPLHHRISGGGHYYPPPPAPQSDEREPRSISQLVNRREDSFSSKEETELGNLRPATSKSSGNSGASTFSESRQSGISFGNVFEKGLLHSKIIPYDSKFPYRLQLPNVSRSVISLVSACLAYRQLSANFMVVSTILFTYTTFLWATCCLIYFITIVKPLLT